MKLENSKMKARKESKAKEMTGNKKSRKRLPGLSKRTRHYIMLALRENSKSRQCINCSVYLLPRVIYLALLLTQCNSLLTKTTGATNFKINFMLSTKSGFIRRLMKNLKNI
jgi:hypothetical protein